MPLKFLIDEDSRDNAYLAAIFGKNLLCAADERINVVCVGDFGAPPFGSIDDDIVHWGAVEKRVIVSQDSSTLVRTYNDIVALGTVTAGLVIIKKKPSPGDFAEYLYVLGNCLDPPDMEYITRYYPE